MTQIPDGAVIIPPSQVYEKVVALTDEVTKLLAQRAEQEKRTEEDRSRISHVEGRQTALEKKVWLIAGLCAGGGGTAGSVVAQLITK